MSNFTYIAVDPRGLELRGTLEVSDPKEALRRVKEMGLFPTRIFEGASQKRAWSRMNRGQRSAIGGRTRSVLTIGRRVKAGSLMVFTRQLATLIEAGMPLLRGLRILHEQEENPRLKEIIGELASRIEEGSQLAEAIATYPKVFNGLYLNMVKAGELGGALDVTLRRLADFLEKAARIKGKIKAALFYPAAVLVVSVVIMGILMEYVIPRFKEVFDGLLGGMALPAFTRFVFGCSDAVKHHAFSVLVLVAGLTGVAWFSLQTQFGRKSFDYAKLKMPLLGPLFRKSAISRFSRTLGTLIANGVPILQALNIVKETAGNLVVRNVVSQIHDAVKEGETMAPRLKASGVFPVMVAGMVDVGEQTGALPEMLLKVADNYDEEIDNAANAMNSLLEPILIVLLAVIVGSIVIAMFLPILHLISHGMGGEADRPGNI
jgi:type IV pilus assembly protein PilC